MKRNIEALRARYKSQCERGQTQKNTGCTPITEEGGGSEKPLRGAEGNTDRMDTKGDWSSGMGRVSGQVKMGSRLVPVVYDNEVTAEEEGKRVLRWFSKLPASELAKSTAKRIEAFDNPVDMRRRLDEVGIDPEIDDEGEVRGAFDFDTGTLYTSSWNDQEISPHNLLHELGHSILGMDEERAESWARAHLGLFDEEQRHGSS